MKDKAKIMTIISGILTVLLGILACIASVLLITWGISGTDPWLMLASLGMIVFWYIFLSFIGFGIGITIIVIGSLEIKLGTLSNYEYSLRKGSIIGYSVFDFVIALISLGGILIFQASPLAIICIVLSALMLFNFILKIIDYSIFKKKVNKGLISIEPKKVNLSNVNLESKRDHSKELEKINELKEKNLITEEEYKNLKNKVLDSISKK